MKIAFLSAYNEVKKDIEQNQQSKRTQQMFDNIM